MPLRDFILDTPVFGNHDPFEAELYVHAVYERLMQHIDSIEGITTGITENGGDLTVEVFLCDRPEPLLKLRQDRLMAVALLTTEGTLSRGIPTVPQLASLSGRIKTYARQTSQLAGVVALKQFLKAAAARDTRKATRLRNELVQHARTAYQAVAAANKARMTPPTDLT